MRAMITGWMALVALATSAYGGVAMTYYVSPAGNDAWSGRRPSAHPAQADGPFRTLAKAVTLLQPGDTCVLRAGVYRETLRPEMSGQPGKPITFRGYRDEVAILSGADVLSGWQPEAKGIYSAPMGWDLQDQNQLFAGEAMLTEARWPNNAGSLLQPTRAVASAGSPTTLTDPNLPGEDGAWTGAWLWCTGGSKWIAWTGRVTGFDARTKTLTFEAQDTGNRWYTPTGGSEYVLMGVREALDAEGEWWVDRQRHRVWLIPPGGRDPEAAGIEAKRRLHAMDLSGRSHLRVTGLHFRAGGILTDDASSDLVLKGLKGEYVAHSYARDTSENSGVLIRGRRNVIHSCEFAFSSGSVLSLQGREHRLINSYLHDGDYGAKWSGTVSLTGRRHVVSHNTIRHSGRDLLSLHGLSESLIQYNDLSHAGWLTHDLGMTYGHNTDFANTVIHHNRVHDNQARGLAMGIYFDCLSQNAIVHHNAIWNVTGDAIRINNPSYFDLVFNNTCYQTNTLEWARTITTFDHSNRQDLFGVRYVNNLLNAPLALAENAIVARNLDRADPGYVAPSEQRFDLKPGSPARAAGMPLPGVAENAGDAAPDLGAFPAGQPLWQAGHDFAHPPKPEPVWKAPKVAWMNGVINAGFEWGTLEGWQKTDAGQARLTPGNGWGNHDGQGPAEATGTSAFELRLGGGADGVAQRIAGLAPDTEYTLSAWVKVSAEDESVCLGVRGHGAPEAMRASQSRQWTRLVLPFRTGPKAKGAVIFLRKTTAGPGYAWCDNVGLPRTPPDR